jgi:hypothetical protein
MAQLVEDEASLITRSRQLAQDLEQLLRSDDRDLKLDVDRAWDIAELRREVQEQNNITPAT